MHCPSLSKVATPYASFEFYNTPSPPFISSIIFLDIFKYTQTDTINLQVLVSDYSPSVLMVLGIFINHSGQNS